MLTIISNISGWFKKNTCNMSPVKNHEGYAAPTYVGYAAIGNANVSGSNNVAFGCTFIGHRAGYAVGNTAHRPPKYKDIQCPGCGAGYKIDSQDCEYCGRLRI